MNKKGLHAISLALMIVANLALCVFYIIVGVIFVGMLLSALGAKDNSFPLFSLFAIWSILNVVLSIVGLVLGRKEGYNRNYFILSILILLFNTGLASVSAYIFIKMPNVICAVITIAVFIIADVLLILDLVGRWKSRTKTQ